jgi:hypothetical protein
MLLCHTVRMQEQKLTNRARAIGYLVGLLAVAVALIAKLVR